LKTKNRSRKKEKRWLVRNIKKTRTIKQISIRNKIEKQKPTFRSPTKDQIHLKKESMDCGKNNRPNYGKFKHIIRMKE
jgi:hypothetical protein